MSATTSKSTRLHNVFWEALGKVAEEENIPRNQLIEEAVFMLLLTGARERPVSKRWRSMRPEERDAIAGEICALIEEGHKAKGTLYNHAIVETLKRDDLRCCECQAQLRLGDVRDEVAGELLAKLAQDARERES